MKTKIERKECGTCRGYGLHAMGCSSPMGPMDASDGLPTIKCPECHMSYNDADPTIQLKSRAYQDGNI